MAFTFQVEYPTEMSQKDLFSLWAEEADTALSAKAGGTVVDLWKCVGERKVLCVVEVESPDDLDRILFDLPIMKKHGQHVQVKVTALRKYEDFVDDVRERLQESS